MQTCLAVLLERCVDRTAAVERSQLLRLVVAEAVRIQAIDDDQVEPAADRIAQREVEFEQLVQRHLLWECHPDVARPIRVAEERVDASSLRSDRADRSHAGDGPRGAEHAQRMAR